MNTKRSECSQLTVLCNHVAIFWEGGPVQPDAHCVQLAQVLSLESVVEAFEFEVDEFRKYCLLNGLDDIGLTLQHADVIKSFEQKHQQAAPWLF